MIIKEGYNGKPLEIRIYGRKYENAQVWLEQTGIPEACSKYQETLAYASIAELLALKKEIDDALMAITGLSEE